MYYINILQVLKCRLLTESWYNNDAIEGAQSSSFQLTPDSPENPLPSSSGQSEEWGERDGGTEKEKGAEHGMEGPLVPALLSKLERLLDQVHTCPQCVAFLLAFSALRLEIDHVVSQLIGRYIHSTNYTEQQNPSRAHTQHLYLITHFLC